MNYIPTAAALDSEFARRKREEAGRLTLRELKRREALMRQCLKILEENQLDIPDATLITYIYSEELKKRRRAASREGGKP